MIIQQSQKDELVKRAVEHREADRLIQRYGYFEAMDEVQAAEYSLPGNNGAKTDWKAGDWAGCAIGCLATPVMTQEEYRAAWKAYMENGDSGDPNRLFKDYDASVNVLEENFGLDPVLTKMAEAVFEKLPKEEAMLWPEQFARALPVGVPFDPGDVADPENSWTMDGDMYFLSSTQSTDTWVQQARDDLLRFLSGVAQNVAA